MRLPERDERIAVAIPSKNRPQYLAVLLASLVHQTYPHWMLVINDQSEPGAETVDVIQDLLGGIRARGHEVRLIREGEGWERHQRTLQAAPPEIEFLLRIDDDVMLSPDYLERVLQPFRLLSARRVAAVGGTIAEPHLTPRDLDVCLLEADWAPRTKTPTWRLQGHSYAQDEILEVPSLLGHSIAYRRSAAESVGGWAVRGYSGQANGEESDMCARWNAAGYRMLVSTRARAWHLYSPRGGSREVRKDHAGVRFLSEVSTLQRDHLLLAARMASLPLRDEPLLRYRLADLEKGLLRPGAGRTARGWLKLQWLRIRRRILYARALNGQRRNNPGE